MTRISTFCLLLLTPAALLAQSAELSGLVSDPASAAIPNAAVELRNQDTGAVHQTKTNGDGLYSLPSLNPGTYLATVQANGFKTLTRDGIVLQVAQRARLDLTLELGSVEDKVTVSGDVPLINTTDASVSTVVDRQFVENLPLNGRSFQSLITLSPGVVSTPTSISGDQGQFSVAGQRAGSNYFTVDGVSANFAVSNGILPGQTSNGGLPAFSALGSTASLVSIDALQEFRLETSTYAAEFGRESGAQAALVTRSGSNRFHGTAFDYIRNDVFDANDWFADSTGQPKPRERQNDFGGVLGGPILKDKTFFFFSYEGLRVAEPEVLIADVPSLAARASAPGNIKALVDAFSLPNGPSTGDGQAQFTASYADPSKLDAVSLRLDQAINPKMTLFGRFNRSPSKLVNRVAPTTLTTSTQTIETGTIGLTGILSPTITNSLRLNYSRAHGGVGWSLDNFGGATLPPASALATSWVDLNSGWVFVNIPTSRDSYLLEGNTANNLNRQFNIVDTVETARGSHMQKFGFDLRRLTPVSAENSTAALYAYVGGGMPAFVSGASPGRMFLYQDPNQIHLRFYNFSSFAQDTWKASRRLTLTYGVRWDFNPPPVETSGHAPYVISEITNLATATLLPPGTPLWHASWTNFAPRLGLSYLLRQDAARATILRVGLGQFYDLGTSTAGFLDSGRGWFPYSLLTVLCNFGSGPGCNGSIPYSGAQPPFVFTQPYSLMRAFDPHLKLPYSIQWNIALEQALSPTQTFKVTYLGSAGRRLLRDDLINNPNPIISNLYLTKNAGYSNYNSLQLQFQRRLSRGLQALVSYSWSHSLDLNSSDVTGGFYDSSTVPSTLFDIHRDYGSSDFDIRHTFSAGITYNIPAAKSQNSLVRAILRDWAVDSIDSARTGTPFNVLYQASAPGAYVDGLGDAIDLRPDSVSAQPVYIKDPNAPGGKRLNTAAFAIPSVVREGSQGRNSIRGFPMLQMDLSIRRQFPINEWLRLQFRAEAFNIINHPNFGNPLNTIGTCAAGVPCAPVYGFGIAQAMLNQSMGTGGNAPEYGNAFGSLYQLGGPRSLQLSMKLEF